VCGEHIFDPISTGSLDSIWTPFGLHLDSIELHWSPLISIVLQLTFIGNDEAPPTAQRAPPPRFSNFQPYASIRRPVGTTTLLGMLRSFRYTALSPLPQLGGSSTPTLFLTGFFSAGWFLHTNPVSHRLFKKKLRRVSPSPTWGLPPRISIHTRLELLFIAFMEYSSHIYLIEMVNTM